MKYTRVKTDPRYESVAGEASIPCATFVDSEGGRYEMDVAVDPKTKERVGFLILKKVKGGRYQMIPLIFDEAVDFFQEYKKTKPKPKNLWEKLKDWYPNILIEKTLKIKQLESKMLELEHELKKLHHELKIVHQGSPLWDKIISLHEDLKITTKALSLIKYDIIGIVSIFIARRALKRIKNRDVFYKLKR